MNIYISASWKQRDKVRALAGMLRSLGHDVYDFTDRSCRNSEEVPPEKFPEKFDSNKHGSYSDYLNSNPYWKEAVFDNANAIDRCDACVLLLPCGIDATADWAYAVGAGKITYVVGKPNDGERHPTHLWADRMFDSIEDFTNEAKQ